jgi:hypothetical protein
MTGPAAEQPHGFTASARWCLRFHRGTSQPGAINLRSCRREGHHLRL